jgi:queuosine precursor transporter
MSENKSQRAPYKFLIFFVAAFISCYITQAVLLNRLISVGYGYITGGTFIYFTSPLILDVVAEVYGYKIARQLVWCGLFSFIFLSTSVYICFKMPYPSFWTPTIEAYNTALHSVVRTGLVSSVTVFIGQMINSYLIVKWKVLTRGKYFWLRSVSSSIIGDSVTVILSILGVFLGRVPHNIFTHNILQELIIMVAFSAIGAIPAAILAKIVARHEGLNRFDTFTNFNPFNITIHR